MTVLKHQLIAVFLTAALEINLYDALHKCSENALDYKQKLSGLYCFIFISIHLCADYYLF